MIYLVNFFTKVKIDKIFSNYINNKMDETDGKKSFNLADLINPDILNKYAGLSKDMNLIEELEEDPLKKRETLRKKLRAKTNTMRIERSSKDMKEKNQINMLKENPLFKNIENTDEETMKKIIDNMASKMTNDPRQKKNAKKQMENLVEKMSAATI